MSTDRTVRWKEKSKNFWDNAPDNSVILDVVISYKCKTQTGEAFEELINTINSSPVRQKIKQVNITDTSYLYRYTIPEFSIYADTSIPTKWFLANKNHIAKLEVAHKLIHWKEGLDNPLFGYWIKKIRINFAGDEKGNGILPEFRQAVLAEAEKFVMKGNGTFSNCIRFILEECAYTCLHFQNSIMAYPASLLAPMEFIVNHYKTNVTQLAYSMSNNAQRRSHSYSDMNEVNYEIVNFITNIATNVNFFVIDKEGNFIYKNDSLGKIISDKENATKLSPQVWKNSLEVMRSQKTAIVEETDKNRHFLSVKSPLIVSNEVEGVIGLSIEITDTKQVEIERKKRERLEFLNKLQEIKLKFQEEFTQFISRMAHDIVSPLISLEFFSKNCKNLLPDQQDLLSGITTSIRNIANDLLQKYKRRERTSKEKRTLASLAISEVIEQKKLQCFYDLKIDFSCDSVAKFAFINVDYSSFARMISNLINNSINACKEIKGQIDINFCISEGKAVFEIRDNGKGMSPDMVEKIMKRIPIESKGGHGLGMTQIFDTVDLYHGQLSLSSKEGKGSEFRIIFPLEGDYLSTKIFMPKNSTIVVIDWDSSIHPILTKLLSSSVDVQNMKIFANTSEALDFFNNVSEDEKNKIFVCIGYNESEVVDVLGILIRYNFLKQCLVITNSYNNLYSQEILKQTSIKIFPRQFLEYAEIILE